MANEDVPVLKPFAKYGDLMTLENFKRDCSEGFFIDYDGSGRLATAKGVSDIEIYPSLLKDKTFVIPSWATHVEWYNK
jgi:hypothetical protein